MLKTARPLTRPTLSRRDVPFPRQGRRLIETGAHPQRYVEDLDGPRTTLPDVFSIVLKHTFDGTTRCRIQFSRYSPCFVGKPAGMHRMLHRFGHSDGILRSRNGGVHEHRISP